MKKGALLAILFSLLLTCTACGKKEPANGPQTDATTTTTAAADSGSTTTAVGEVGIEDLIPTTGKPVTRMVTEKGGKTVTDKEKKPGFFKRLGRFFRELKAELKKVAWPTRADTMKKTGVVILCVIVVGVIVWIFDGIASGVVNALLALFGG